MCGNGFLLVDIYVYIKDKVAKQVKNLPATAPDIIIDYYYYEIVMFKFPFV